VSNPRPSRAADSALIVTLEDYANHRINPDSAAKGIRNWAAVTHESLNAQLDAPLRAALIRQERRARWARNAVVLVVMFALPLGVWRFIATRR